MSVTSYTERPAGWQAFWRFNARFPLLTIVIIFTAGIIFWGGFNTSLEITNTEAFCISCHEMEENVYQEYKETVHFKNRTGVRATCPDCHVPREWIHKVVRKIRASNELYHKLVGTIDTREKFIDRRWQLAKAVWRSMEATDSRECRNCHGFTYMDWDKQTTGAGDRHSRAEQAGKTCIDCHKGIAHELPESFLESEHERFEKEKVPCADCHEGMARTSSEDDWDWDDNN